jgi:hypothetical protein
VLDFQIGIRNFLVLYTSLHFFRRFLCTIATVGTATSEGRVRLFESYDKTILCFFPQNLICHGNVITFKRVPPAVAPASKGRGAKVAVSKSKVKPQFIFGT